MPTIGNLSPLGTEPGGSEFDESSFAMFMPSFLTLVRRATYIGEIAAMRSAVRTLHVATPEARSAHWGRFAYRCPGLVTACLDVLGDALASRRRVAALTESFRSLKRRSRSLRKSG
jgi:hypothetical protein